MAAVRPVGDFPDASEMLAEALKQMDGLLADTTKSDKGQQQPRTGSQNGMESGGGSTGSRRIRYGGWTADVQGSPPSTSNAQSGKGDQQPSSRGMSLSSSTDPHKLDLMAENSSLKVKLARTEKNLRDTEDRLSFTQRQVNDLQSRLNDRTIELTELRTRLANSTSSTASMEHSLIELEKLKRTVESLLIATEHKNQQIDDLQSLVRKYRKLEAMVAAQTQGAKVLEQLGLDSESSSYTASLPRTYSLPRDAHLQAVNVCDPLKPSMPYPSATSTPVSLHTTSGTGGSLPRRTDINGGKSPSQLSTIMASPSPDKNTVLPQAYDDIDIESRVKTLPSARTRAPDIASSGGGTGYVKGDADDETLKDEMAQEYKALQNQQPVPAGEAALKKKSSSRSIKKFFGKLKRSNSQDLDDKMDEFKRNGLRSTAGPRLGWSKEVNDLDLPFTRWDSDRIALWLHVIGLSAYVGNCKRWGRNGEQLLQATTHDLEKELGIRNYYHRKKLQLALESVAAGTQSPAANLDHNWVTRWLDDIGLPQYKDQFTEARIDGRMLHCMTVDDLVGLKVANTLHHLSFRRGIEVLRMNNFNPVCLKRRPSPDEGQLHNCPAEVLLWTNHRVMEWLRSIDLSEYAPNLRGSGVHGALMVLEPRFGAEVFATLLSIPANKTLLRRHLSTHFVALIGNGVQQQKREMEQQPGFIPLTPGQKVKVKKSIFRIGRSDGKEDLICPVDPSHDNRSRTQLNGAAVLCNFELVPQEMDERSSVGVDDDDDDDGDTL